MTFYITPNGRIYRRRGWSQPVQNEQVQETDYDVFVPVNVKVEDEEFVITALVPGVKADNLNIQMHNETLTIQGELEGPENGSERFLVRELPVGKFYRVIHLPEQLDANKAVADLSDGVLTLRVPKTEEARPKTIKVMAN